MINPKDRSVRLNSSKSMKTKEKKLSVNKMAEYLDARPARRASIVKQQQSGKGHPAQYYSLAQAAMRRILVAPAPAAQFTTEIAMILSHTGWGQHPKQLVQNNAAALKGMWEAVSPNELFTSGTTYRKPLEQIEPRSFGDVQLTNRFDVESVTPAHKPKYGGIKFYFNKNHPLSEFSGSVLGALLNEASINSHGAKSVSRNDIIVIDAFQSTIFRAPCHMKQHVAEAAAAAQEFSIQWDHIAKS